MSGISFLTLVTVSGAGVSGPLAGIFGVSLMDKVYTRVRAKRRVIQRLQGGALRERLLARGTGQEIDGFSDGHGDTKIEAHAFVLAGGW